MKAVAQLEKEYRLMLSRSGSDGVRISQAAREKAKMALEECLGELAKGLNDATGNDED